MLKYFTEANTQDFIFLMAAPFLLCAERFCPGEVLILPEPEQCESVYILQRVPRVQGEW